jgi:carboxyl-terminal processing protease
MKGVGMRNGGIALRLRASVLAMAALATACGGGGGGSLASGGGASPPPSPPPTSSCTLRDRQNWAFAQLQEWYLFPDTLPASLDPSPYSSLTAYVDALTATARSQRRDRFFTYVTSIAEENAFFNSGATAGFGIRLGSDPANTRLFVAEAFEGAPALAAGIDRGTEILAIGDTPSTLRTVSSIFASEGATGINNALGPSTVGTTRTFQIVDASGTRIVTVSKATYDLIPVSSRYGVKIISDGSRQVAYLNLRTFISTADDQLRTAFNQFRTAGITDFIIDFRYNGGGLVSTAELMGDLLGGNRLTSEVYSNTTFRPEKASNNSIRRFAPQSQSVSPVRIAFITTGSTASASELVINSFIPYLGANLAIVGANSFGKPVGQIALDRQACDDRLRAIAFSTQNSANGGFYYDGLAKVVPNSCQAVDDIARPLGDAQEASVRGALDFLAGRSCTPIASGGQTAQSVGSRRTMLTPANPTVPQREVPGLF